MSVADRTLEEIAESLKPKVLSAKASDEPIGKSHVDLADALLTLPEISEALKQVAAERKAENDIASLITGFDLSLQRVMQHSESNLAKINNATSLLQTRIDQFNATEAKYQRLIERVENVLDELERVLKKM